MKKIIGSLAMLAVVCGLTWSAAEACEEHEKGKHPSGAKATEAQTMSVAPAVHATEHGAPQSQVHLKIVGMRCAMCSQAIEKKVTGLSGVASCVIDHAKGTGTVSFDAAKTNPDAIVAAVKDAGFDATIAR